MLISPVLMGPYDLIFMVRKEVGGWAAVFLSTVKTFAFFRTKALC